MLYIHNIIYITYIYGFLRYIQILSNLTCHFIKEIVFRLFLKAVHLCYEIIEYLVLNLWV